MKRIASRRDFWFPPRSSWVQRSSGLLRSK